MPVPQHAEESSKCNDETDPYPPNQRRQRCRRHPTEEEASDTAPQSMEDLEKQGRSFPRLVCLGHTTWARFNTLK